MGNWESVLNVTTQFLQVSVVHIGLFVCDWREPQSFEEVWIGSSRVKLFHVLILHVVSRRFDIFWRLHNICVYHLLYRKTVMFATQLLLIVLAWSLIACYWEWPECCFGGLKAWHECLHFLCHRIRNAILCHTAPMLYWWKAESQVLTLRVWTWLSKILRLWRVNTWTPWTLQLVACSFRGFKATMTSRSQLDILLWFVSLKTSLQ